MRQFKRCCPNSRQREFVARIVVKRNESGGKRKSRLRVDYDRYDGKVLGGLEVGSHVRRKSREKKATENKVTWVGIHMIANSHDS